MSDPCFWLPPLIMLTDHGGEWGLYLEVIYDHFRRDFVDHCPSLDGRPCRVFGKLVDGKEETFWHITSTGEVEDERIPDLRRCERVRWPRPLIETFPADLVRAWRVERKKKKRINLAPSDFSYLVVLDERPRRVSLITAYWIEKEHHRRKLRTEWDRNHL